MIADTSGETSQITRPSGLMWGVTFKIMPMSRYWTVLIWPPRASVVLLVMMGTSEPMVIEES